MSLPLILKLFQMLSSCNIHILHFIFPVCRLFGLFLKLDQTSEAYWKLSCQEIFYWNFEIVERDLSLCNSHRGNRLINLVHWRQILMPPWLMRWQSIFFWPSESFQSQFHHCCFSRSPNLPITQVVRMTQELESSESWKGFMGLISDLPSSNGKSNQRLLWGQTLC